MLLMAEADKDDEVEVEVDISLNASGVVGEDGDFPNVPMREILSSPPNHIFGVYPPVVHRDSKPLSPKLPQRSLGDNRRKPSWVRIVCLFNLFCTVECSLTLTISIVP